MHAKFVLFRKKGIHLKPDEWEDAFTNQTGHNVNVTANGIRKILRLLVN